jgi:hypothetical protein
MGNLMALQNSIVIDEKELSQIVKDLDQLFPDSDTKLRNTLRSALRKAARPLVPAIRSEIDKGLKSLSKWKNLRGTREAKAQSGQLKKSIGIISGKTSRGRKPAVYVGPRVKKSWASKDKTGFYFYFLEYGKAGVSPRRMLDTAAQAKGNEVMGDVIGKLKVIISKRWAKKLG